MDADNSLISQLLAERLPRRNYRCGTCKHWDSDDGQEGECTEEVPGRGNFSGNTSEARDGCRAYYFPRQLEWYDEEL